MSSSNIIYLQRSIDSKIFPLSGAELNTTHSTETCGLPHCISVTPGVKGIRFELKKNDPTVGSSKKKRDEVVIVKPVPTPNMWYGYDIMFPSVGYETDSTRSCLNQHYEDGSSEVTLREANDNCFLENLIKQPDGSSTHNFDLFGKKIPKDQWNNFVFNIYHSTDAAKGRIRIWRNGVLIHDWTGKTIHLQLPKFKLGVYKASFLDGSSKVDNRVVFFDNIKLGKDGTTIEEMIGSVIPPADNKPPVVDAGADSTIKLPISSVTFKIIATDPDNDVVTTTISQVSGPNTATISGQTASGLTEGVYVFKVKGVDQGGLSSEDTTTVTVVKADTPPPAGDKYKTTTIVEKNGVEIKRSVIDY